MHFYKTTEAESKYKHLEKMPINTILKHINDEDKTVSYAVEKVLDKISILITHIVEKMKQGGRLFYIGAGTSGRLGLIDASECPPTFGVPYDWVIGIIAGGENAIKKAVENAEDDTRQGWKDLQKHNISNQDIVVGIAASGTTPYVIKAIEQCNEQGIITACITCNVGSPLAKISHFPIEVLVGPEFLTGSSRMKAGTAQKLILNMISTATMIQLGRVKDNKMIDMRLSNDKLVQRAILMLMQEINVDEKQAQALLIKYDSVREAAEAFKKTL